VNTWKPILAALLIFAAGVVTGGLTVRIKSRAVNRPLPPQAQGADRGWQARRPEAELRELSQRFERRLQLSPEQRARVEAIVNESRERMTAIARDVAPKTREEFKRMRERIREELTPEQRREFEEIFRQRETSRRRTGAETDGRPVEAPAQNGK